GAGRGQICRPVLELGVGDRDGGRRRLVLREEVGDRLVGEAVEAVKAAEHEEHEQAHDRDAPEDGAAWDRLLRGPAASVRGSVGMGCHFILPDGWRGVRRRPDAADVRRNGASYDSGRLTEPLASGAPAPTLPRPAATGRGNWSLPRCDARAELMRLLQRTMRSAIPEEDLRSIYWT